MSRPVQRNNARDALRPRQDDSPGRRRVTWTLAAAALALAVFVGFFVHGGRLGLYSDDYSHKVRAFDLDASRWTLNLRPASSMRPLAYIVIQNLANAIPDHELPVRVGLVALHVLNATLLALLAFRLTRSALTASLVGPLFLMPVFAHEGLLWFTAAVSNVVELLLLLLGFHLLLSCRSLRRDRALLVSGALAWVIAALFFESGIFVPVLLPALMSMSAREERAESIDHRIWVLALASSFLLQALYYVSLVRGSPLYSRRGGMTLDLGFLLFHRLPAVARRTYWLLTEFGVSRPLPEAFRLGWREWTSAAGGPVVLGALALALVSLSFAYPAARQASRRERNLLGLVLVGLAWVALCFTLLIIFRAQTAETRIFYVPSAGLALAVGALLGWIVRILPGWPRLIAIRSILLAASSLLFISTLVMSGLVRTYQLRWELDQEQLAGLRAAIPKLPDVDPLWLLPVSLDERTVSRVLGGEAALDRLLAGAFELPWSAADAVRLEYRVRGIRSVAATRWDRLHLTALRRSDDGAPRTIVLQGAAVPLDRALAFTYREGRLVILNPLRIDTASGASFLVDLPLAAEIAGRGTTEPVRLELEP